jgi:phosphoribosylaminoimidazolecarboxamide formyltransferase/IMP cyclohydrolase
MREIVQMSLQKRALISVSDKTGVVELARGLVDCGYTIVSTGGTARALTEAGVPVVEVSEHTGHPEILGGRVKTLHPRVHGGILADLSRPEHAADLRRTGIDAIDLVVVNLYPFRDVAARPDATIEELIETIDIGGPAMVRSAAKNHGRVGIVVHPGDYPMVLAEIRAGGGLQEATRRRLAARAFAHTAAYDASIRDELDRRFSAGEARPSAVPLEAQESFPETLALKFRRLAALRYGENPHQRGALYADAGETDGTIAGAHQLQGKELSFNNLLDLDAAWRVVLEFSSPAAAVIKHNNPCGVAVGPSLEEAFKRARRTDPISAFGGIVAFNREVDATAAAEVAPLFLECVIAPAYAADSREILAARKALRVMQVTPGSEGHLRGFDLRRITGGLLVQDWDRDEIDLRRARVVSRRSPAPDELRAMDFAWRVA